MILVQVLPAQTSVSDGIGVSDAELWEPLSLIFAVSTENSST